MASWQTKENNLHQVSWDKYENKDHREIHSHYHFIYLKLGKINKENSL